MAESLPAVARLTFMVRRTIVAKTLVCHGMVIAGSPSGAHYGPVAIGDVDENSREQCRKFGQIVAELAAKLHG